MKVIIFYFDHRVTNILTEQISEDGTKSIILSSPHNFVSANEIVAKVVDVDDPQQVSQHLDPGYQYYHAVKYIPIKAKIGIYFDSNTYVYRAEDYGFVRLLKEKNELSLLSPVRIPKDKMKAYYLVHPTRFKKLPSVDFIEKTLMEMKIFSMVDRKKLQEELDNIDLNNPKLHRLVVASGKDAVNGYNDYFEPLIDIEKKAGKLLEDGSIDFKETGSIIQVSKRQEILKKIPGLQTEDGYDIYGSMTRGIMEEGKGYNVGENIAASTDPMIYCSLIDGCIVIENKKISVSPVSFVNGDVDYDSGNIDFNGSVQIKGSILPGFSVKATGDVTVAKNIDDATIEAGGNVIVKIGIGGKGMTHVTAGKSIKTKYILNADVKAMGEILVSESIINSTVFSNDKVTVTDKSGKIIGGETTALNEIAVKVSGVEKENKTVLTVGKNIIIEKELQAIKDRMAPVNAKLEELNDKIKISYGEQLFRDAKEYIKFLPPVKKKACLELLAQLTNVNKELNTLKVEYRDTEAKLKFEKEPRIIVYRKAHPGTVIKIKSSVRALNEPLDNVKFFEDEEDRTIRFTAAT